MNWRASLSDEEAKEMYENCCSSYWSGTINDIEFRLQLSKLGYNATDIAEAERFYRPSPPEGEHEGDSD